MGKDITFGQYYPGSSFIHKMDPRAKLVLAVVYIVAVFLCTNFYCYLAVFCFLVLIMLISRVPVKSVLRSIKAILFLVVMTMAINVLFYKEGKVLFSWGIIKITSEGLQFTAKMAMRLVFLVLGTTMVTLTTTPMTLTDGLENLMTPLKYIKVPIHDIALIMSIALRFIPSLMDEINKIMMAQKARGASFDTGNLFARAKALIPVLIPLFVSSFRIAEDLALALDARCYNCTPNRTKMKVLKFTFRDIIGLFFTAALVCVVVFLRNGFWGLI